VVIPDSVRAALREHAEAEAPNEACGLIALRDGVAERYVPGINELASPYRFQWRPVDPMDAFLEDEGYEIAIFHTHPETAAKPSRTDLANIGEYEGYPYVIYSLAQDDLRAWRIRAGEATEEPLNRS
jgi:proteasome lid subunit RPN8/RPN11